MIESNPDFLQTLATKASPLSEALSALLARHQEESNQHASYLEDESRERFRQGFDLWCQIVGRGNRSKLERRLEWSGITPEVAQCLLAQAGQISLPHVPSWVATLEDIIATAQSFQLDSSVLKPDSPIPFQELYLPCVAVGSRRVEQECSSCIGLLSDTAWRSLQLGLLNSIARICSPSLMKEFSEFRTCGSSLKDFFQISIQGKTQTKKYQAFIHHHLDDGLCSLLDRYSVLGRLMATTVDFWVESTVETLTRLQSDWDKLVSCFAPSQCLQHVIDVEVGLSDPHKRGRSVLILTFDTGLKVVYKPKNLGLEVAFNALLDWCNVQDAGLQLKYAEIINCSSYGWSEFIPHSPCQDNAGIQEFFYRLGMLMCLLYILRGIDFHYENIISLGEYPILIDLETLLIPPIQSSTGDAFSNDEAKKILSEEIGSSVLRTAILPQRQLTLFHEEELIDLSYLGMQVTEGNETSVWQHINTDGMTIGVEIDNSLKEGRSLPSLVNGESISPEGFIGDLLAGFEATYRMLKQRQDMLLSRQGPLMLFQNQTCRMLVRNTRIYNSILGDSYDPSLMQIGVARSIGLDVLSRAFLNSEQKPGNWSLLQDEIASLEQCDIPFFTINSSYPDLMLDNGGVISNFFDLSSIEALFTQVRSLSDSGLSFQKKIIQLSLYSRFHREPTLAESLIESDGTKELKGSEDISQTISSNELLNVNDLINHAIAIASQLKKDVVEGTDGSVNWLSVGYNHKNQSFSPQEMSLNLYDGACGIGLFFAALASLTQPMSHLAAEHQSDVWHGLSMASTASLRYVLNSSKSSKVLHLWSRRLGIGGGVGLGSILYGITQISKLLARPELIVDAQHIASLITPELIEADRQFDVIAGSSGTILGLLALVEHLEGDIRQSVLDKAIDCGQHLLDHQVGPEGNPRAWVTWRGKRLTGFSRGAAGIAYALLRLFDVTQDERFRTAAIEAIAYEQTCFSKADGNWADLRAADPDQAFQVSWAHGAAGIALARLAGLVGLDTGDMHHQIEIALNTTQKHLNWGIDSLCWGTLGRIETLLFASQQLNQSDLLYQAHQATAKLLKRVESEGTFKVFQKYPSTVPYPGFFHGFSGIGYQLLRLAAPTQIPSVLAWEV